MNSTLRFLSDEGGPTAVEYAVMLAMIMLARIGIISYFGSVSGGSFNDSSDKTGTFISDAMN